MIGPEQLSGILPFIITPVAIFQLALPLLLSGLSALSGAAKGGSQSGSNTSQEDFIRNLIESSQTDSRQETRTTFDPKFAAQFDQASEGILSRLAPVNLDQDQLDQQQLLQTQQANQLADNVASQVAGVNAQRGLSASPGAAATARGFGEAARGNSLATIAANFAKRRFELPLQQEQANASQRNSLLQFLSQLPRNQVQTGTQSNTRNVEQTGSSTREGTQTVQGQGLGSRILEGVGAGLATGQESGLFNIGQGGNAVQSNAFVNTNLFRPQNPLPARAF